MNRRKQKFAQDFKRIISFTLSVIFLFTLFAGSGCGKEKKIEEYPEPEIIETEETDQPQPAVVIEEEKAEMSDEEFAELIALSNAYETGQFAFTPDAIPPTYARGFRNRPEIVQNAKLILQTVYNGDTEGEVPSQYAVSIDDFLIAKDLAEKANPMVFGTVMGNSEDGTVFHVTYYPKYVVEKDEDGEISNIEMLETEHNKVKTISDAFLDYVSETIERNVSKEDSDMEKAEAVYKAMVSDFSPVYKKNNSQDQYVINTENGEEDADTSKRNLLEDIQKGELDQLEIAQLYQFTLTQLGIECMIVTSYGTYTSQNVEELDKFISDNWYNIWNVVVSDGKAYNCDLFFEMSVLEKQKKVNPHTEPDMTYFGMSDAVRSKSFEANRDKLAEYTYIDPYDYFSSKVKGSIVPECSNDYYLR